MNGLFSKTIGMLSDMVGARSQRHQVLSSNVSNIDTPGYEPKDVDFQNLIASMQQKGVRLARTNGKHLPASTPGGSLSVVRTGEQVSLDKEMVSIAENHLMHNAAVEMLARKFRGLQIVLREGK
ncbi:MAG TPA: flagellar basal body rod protein FlgB [Deltaproteobacteria bacterium]|nr:flagellar basal body rod protein FlgB [Deltaproteobacteria bacterium]